MTDIVTPQLVINPHPKFEGWRFGEGRHTAFVIDDVLSNPEVLVEVAAQSAFGPPPPTSKYPGLVAPVSTAYLNMMAGLLQPSMSRIFNLHPDRHLPGYGFFGLATVAPDQLSPAQAAPHTDANRLDSYATVHYLSHTDFGGTAFYRHKSTGSELVLPSGSAKFNHFRRQELDKLDGQPVSAIADLYDEICYIEPKFNRLVLYRAGQIHSARIAPDAALTDDPLTGRLTANLFFNTEGL